MRRVGRDLQVESAADGRGGEGRESGWGEIDVGCCAWWSGVFRGRGRLGGWGGRGLRTVGGDLGFGDRSVGRE